MDDEPMRRAMRALWILLVGAALADAARGRRRHGEVFGLVPYDFRVPTAERVRNRMWDPDSPRILTPTTFGVGWGVNLGRLARLAHVA